MILKYLSRHISPDNIDLDTEWHSISGEEFVDFVNRTYDDIIHWRKDLFKLPSSKAIRLMNLPPG